FLERGTRPTVRPAIFLHSIEKKCVDNPYHDLVAPGLYNDRRKDRQTRNPQSQRHEGSIAHLVSNQAHADQHRVRHRVGRLAQLASWYRVPPNDTAEFQLILEI